MLIILLTFSLVSINNFFCTISIEVKNDPHKCERIVRSCVKKAFIYFLQLTYDLFHVYVIP